MNLTDQSGSGGCAGRDGLEPGSWGKGTADEGDVGGMSRGARATRGRCRQYARRRDRSQESFPEAEEGSDS